MPVVVNCVGIPPDAGIVKMFVPVPPNMYVGLTPEHVVLVHGERDQRHNLAIALRTEGLNVADEPEIVIPAQ